MSRNYLQLKLWSLVPHCENLIQEKLGMEVVPFGIWMKFFIMAHFTLETDNSLSTARKYSYKHQKHWCPLANFPYIADLFFDPGVKPRNSFMLGKCFTTELQLQPLTDFLHHIQTR